MIDHDEEPMAPMPSARLGEEMPTVRDHAERTGLAKWQVGALLARLHGSVSGGASLNMRMSTSDFDAALAVALHGRI